MRVGKGERVNPSPCLFCGKILDAATGVAEDGEPTGPEEGSITICIGCGHIMAFDHELRLRSLTDEEIREVAGNAIILAVQEARLKAAEKWNYPGHSKYAVFDEVYQDARREHAFILRMDKLTLEAVGRRLGVSKTQASSLIQRRARRLGLSREMELVTKQIAREAQSLRRKQRNPPRR